MTMMQAALLDAYGPAEGLRVGATARPTPRPRDVLVRVHASSVNPVDVKQRAGVQRFVVRKSMPTILGMDLSGIVEEVGAAVTEFAPGDAVFASPTHRRPGTWAEFVAVDVSEVALKPRSIRHEEAASLPLVALTAWACLVDAAQLQRGQSVLVLVGSGGVGTFAVQLARHLGATVTATCGAANMELVASLGAQRVIDYRAPDALAGLSPFDVVLDAVGPSSWASSLSLVRRGGSVASIASGLPELVARHGPALGVLVTAWGLLVSAGGARWSGRRLRHVVRPADGRRLAAIGALVDSGAVRPVVERVYPLSEIVQANRHVESGRARGKVVLSIRA